MGGEGQRDRGVNLLEGERAGERDQHKENQGSDLLVGEPGRGEEHA
jgi:hypothetical protein